MNINQGEQLYSGGCRSGTWNYGSNCGLFLARLGFSSSSANSNIGSRLPLLKESNQNFINCSPYPLVKNCLEG